MAHEHHHPQSELTIKKAYNYVNNLVVQPLACFGELMMHQGMGIGVYPPFMHLIAAISPLAFVMFWGDQARQRRFQDPADSPVLLSYLPLAFLVMSAIHRLDRRTRRTRIESGYTGWPMLLNVFPFLGELFTKRFVEPALLVGGGMIAFDHGIQRPLASYAMAVGACMFIASCQRAAREEWDTQVAFDAQMEAKRASARFREVSGQ